MEKWIWLTRVNEQAMNNWEVAYSTGIGFNKVPITFQHNPNIYQSSNNYQLSGNDDHLSVGDFNADGKTDIVIEFENSNYTSHYYDVYYSKGNLENANAVNNFSFNHITNSGSMNMGRHIYGDFNGDGRIDFIDRGAYSSPIDFVFFGKNSQERLLKKVADGFGNITEYNYNLLTSSNSFYIKDATASYPLNDIQAPIYALSSIKLPDGIGGILETTFKYEGLKLHKTGRGLLGFRKIITENNIINSKTEIESSIEPTFFVPYNVKTKNYNTNTNVMVSLVENTDVFTSLGGYRYKMQNAEEKNTNGLSGSIAKVEKQYDNFGNVSILTSSIDNLEQVVTNTNFGAFANTVPNRPTKITVQKTRLGTPLVSIEKTFAYDALGRLIQEKEFSNMPQWKAKNYTYNIFGNMITENMVGANVTLSPTISKLYDNKGRVPISITNPLLQTETYEYDFIKGVVLHKTSVEGVQTYFEYDGFGRNTKTINVDPIGMTNIETTSALNWNGSTGQYLQSISTTGQPGKVILYDNLGREKLLLSSSFGSNILLTANEYNNKGQIVSVTKPFFWGQSPTPVTNQYDDYGRIIATIDPLTGTIQKTYAYNGNILSETTILPNGNTKINNIDASGKLVNSKENANTIFYNYNSWGSIKRITFQTAIQINTFDDYGRMVSSVDMNAGTKTTSYNAYDQVISETNGNGNTTNYEYDILGRVIKRTGVEGVTNFEFYTTAGVRLNKLKKITGFNGINEEYIYNNRGSVLLYSKLINGTNYSIKYHYDNIENLIQKEYVNSGFKLNYEYNANNFLTKIKNNSGIDIYSIQNKNAFGLVENYTLGNGANSVNTFLEGHLTNKNTPSIQDYTIDYNWNSGTIIKRTDQIHNLSEDFQYDIYNRLTQASIAGLPNFFTSYLLNGNISTKTDASGNQYQYMYNTVKRNAVEKIVNVQNPLICPPDYNSSTQQITYTPFDRPSRISENIFEYNLTYGSDYQRAITEQKENGVVTKTKYYIDDMEVDIANGNTEYIHYIEGEDGLVAIAKVENGVEELFYTYTDHLGSILTVTDASANIIAEQSFDVWGRNRNPIDWTYNNIPTIPSWLTRGFTMHEHLPEFNLINMNARLYDPYNGRMLSPDKFIQDPSNAQNLNRYSYALNNPMSYVDPSGNSLLAVVIVGAVVMSYSAGVMANDGQINPTKWIWDDKTTKYLIGGAVVGAVGGYFGFAIAGSTLPFAGTLSIVGSSFVAGVGMTIVSGGNTPVMISFGVGSYNFKTGKFRGIWDWGDLKTMEKIGYTFGALQNLQDLFSGLNGVNGEYDAEYGDIPHARFKGVSNNGDKIDISVAHIDPTKYSKTDFDDVSTLHTVEYGKYWATHIKKGYHFLENGHTQAFTIKINNVNGKFLAKMTENIGPGNYIQGKGLWGIGKLRYGTTMFGCQSHVAHALLGIGIPTLPINVHPMVLYLQLNVRQIGIYSSPYLIY